MRRSILLPEAALVRADVRDKKMDVAPAERRLRTAVLEILRFPAAAVHAVGRRYIKQLDRRVSSRLHLGRRILRKPAVHLGKRAAPQVQWMACAVRSAHFPFESIL